MASYSTKRPKRHLSDSYPLVCSPSSVGDNYVTQKSTGLKNDIEFDDSAPSKVFVITWATTLTVHIFQIRHRSCIILVFILGERGKIDTWRAKNRPITVSGPKNMTIHTYKSHNRRCFRSRTILNGAYGVVFQN